MAPLPPAVIASIIGGGISSLGQMSANQQNLRIAREQNAHNLNMLNLANQYNRDMWNKTNEYNTPLNQRKRFEEAGLNPALMLGQFTPGVAQGSTSATPAPAVGATMQNTMEGISNGISAGVNTFIQDKLAKANIRKLEADAQREEIKNTVLPDKEKAELNKLYADTLKVNADVNRVIFDLELAKKLEPHQIQEYAERVKAVVTDTELKKVQTDLAKYELKNVAPAKLKELYVNMSSAYAHIKYLAIQGNVAEKTIEQMTTQIGVMEAQKLGIQANTEQVRQLTKPMRNQLIMQAKHLNEQAEYTKARRENISFENSMQVYHAVDATLNTVIRGVSAVGTLGLSEIGGS